MSTGIILDVKSLFHPMREVEYFNDQLFWHVDEDEEGTIEDQKSLTDISKLNVAQ